MKALKATPSIVPATSDDPIDPQSLAKKRPPTDALHLNVRVTGDDVQIFEHLRNRTPSITDSLRVRDSVRIAVFLLAMREKGLPIKCADRDGKQVDVLDYLGVFLPEGPSRPRLRSRAAR